MMPNGHDKKDYGKHDYAEHDGTSDCVHGCGCWAGPARSGGPTGLDPFGCCPNNPTDGERRSARVDYNDVVEQRIRKLESRATLAECELKAVAPGEKELAQAVKKKTREIARLRAALREVKRMVAEWE